MPLHDGARLTPEMQKRIDGLAEHIAGDGKAALMKNLRGGQDVLMVGGLTGQTFRDQRRDLEAQLVQVEADSRRRILDLRRARLGLVKPPGRETEEQLRQHVAKTHQLGYCDLSEAMRDAVTPPEPELLLPPCSHAMMVQVHRGHIQDPGHLPPSGVPKERWAVVEVCYDCGHPSVELGPKDRFGS